MRKYTSIAIGALLLLGACTSADDDDVATPEQPADDSTTTAPSEDVVEDDRAPGVTDDTIKIGVSYLDFTSLRERGTNIDHGDYQASFQAVADSINDDGGINGRMLELVFGPNDPSVDSTTAATCTKLTQDDPVFVAVGTFLNDEVLCYVSVNETAVVGGTMTNERLEQANAPWYTTDPSEDLEGAVATTLAEEGALDGSVAVVGMAAEQNLVDETVVPNIEDAGVDVVETAVIDAPPEDTAANLAAARTIAERFESSGADTVLVVGSAPLAFGQGLAQTSYRPELVFTRANDARSYAGAEGNDLSILEGSLYGGVFGPQDDQLELPGVTEECFSIVEEAVGEIQPPSEVPDGEPDKFVSAQVACEQMYLLKAILEEAGEDLDYGTFQTAGNQLGEVELPVSPDPWNFGAPPSADGDPPLYLFEWDASSQSFVRAE